MQNREIDGYHAVGHTFLKILGKIFKSVFHLIGHIKKELPKFEGMANEIKDSLLQKAVSEEMGVYVNKLRHRFGYDPQSLDIPSDFEPFVLR